MCGVACPHQAPILNHYSGPAAAEGGRRRSALTTREGRRKFGVDARLHGLFDSRFRDEEASSHAERLLPGGRAMNQEVIIT